MDIRQFFSGHTDCHHVEMPFYYEHIVGLVGRIPSVKKHTKIAI